MKNIKFTSMGKKTAHLISRNILSTAAVIALMGAAAFAAAPAGGYLPGATLDPDCAPNDTDCIIQGGDMTPDSWTMSGANIVVENGNVGIGTDSPAALLDMERNGFHLGIEPGYSGKTYIQSFTGAGVFAPLSIDATELNLRTFGPNPIILKTDSAERLRIDETGNVGIGTTAPRSPLQVGVSSSLFTAGTNDNLHLSNNLHYDGTGYKRIQAKNEASLFSLGGNGNISFFSNTGTGNTVDSTITLKNNMVITKEGNVGIGTTNPNADLVVGDNFGATIDGSPSGAGIFGSNLAMNSSYKYITPYSHANYGFSGMNANWGGIDFLVGIGATTKDQEIIPTNAMKITNTGNVGIGTTAPSVKLDVAGTVKIESTLNTGTSLFQLKNAGGTLATFYNNDHITMGGGSGDSLAITGAGNVGIGTTAPTSNLHVRGLSPELQLRSTDTGARGLWTKVDDINEVISFTSSYNNTGAYPIVYKFGGAEKVRFEADGSVGIGTTTPEEKLDVDGTVKSDAITSDHSVTIDNVAPSDTNTVNLGYGNYMVTIQGVVGGVTNYSQTYMYSAWFNTNGYQDVYQLGNNDAGVFNVALTTGTGNSIDIQNTSSNTLLQLRVSVIEMK